MSQFGQWDAHIEPSQTVVHAVWEVTLNTVAAGTPAADDLIEWGASGFTVGTGSGTGVVVSWDAASSRLRFYRSSDLGSATEADQKAAFPIDGDVLRKYTAVGPAFTGFTSAITTVAKKNARGYHINPPWFTGTPPTTRTQTALAVGDMLVVESILATNIRRTVIATDLGVDTFKVDSNWSADEITDSPAICQYASGFTANQQIPLPSSGDRLAPEIISRGFNIIDAALYRHLVTLTADVPCTASTLYQNITGLSFTVASGTNYRWMATILYTASATTVGVRVAVSAPAFTHNAYFTQVGLAATGSTSNAWVNSQTAVDSGVVATSSVATTGGNIILAWGVIRPSAAGTLQLRFAPETAFANDIIIEAGSTLEWW